MQMPYILKKEPKARLVFVGGESMSNKLSKDREVYRTRAISLIKRFMVVESKSLISTPSSKVPP